MSDFKELSLDDIHKKVQATRARLAQSDEYIAKMGEGAKKVGLSISGATLELNAIMKNLFLCACNDLQEYDILYETFLQHLRDLNTIVSTRFGKIKPEDLKIKTETH